MAMTGGCQCGAVRFTAEADPITVRACWCRDCQYAASGNAAVNVLFPSAGFSVNGETNEFVSTADSGTVMHRRFCPRCGTPLFSQAESRPHIVVVRAGALDDREAASPQGTIWAASKPSWGYIDTDLPCTEGQPAPPPPPQS